MRKHARSHSVKAGIIQVSQASDRGSPSRALLRNTLSGSRSLPVRLKAVFAFDPVDQMRPTKATASGKTKSPPPMGAVGGGENAGRFRYAIKTPIRNNPPTTPACLTIR